MLPLAAVLLLLGGAAGSCCSSGCGCSNTHAYGSCACHYYPGNRCMCQSLPTPPPPTRPPTRPPTAAPSSAPTVSPSASPATSRPTTSPTTSPPSATPSAAPTVSPTASASPTTSPPTGSPETSIPTAVPTAAPATSRPTRVGETWSPTASTPTAVPTEAASTQATTATPTAGTTTLPSLAASGVDGAASATWVLAAIAAGVILLGVPLIIRRQRRWPGPDRPAPVLKSGATATAEPPSRPVTINPVYDRPSSPPTDHGAHGVGICVAKVIPSGIPATARGPAVPRADPDGYEVPADVGTDPEGYEIPLGAAAVYGHAVVMTSVASYEIPYDNPGADAALYGSPTPAPEPAAPAARRPTLQRPPRGSDGIRRTNTNRKPSRYDGFGTPVTGSAGAGILPTYEQPESNYEPVDYSQMEAYPPPQNKHVGVDAANNSSAAPIKACAYIAGDGMKCVGPRVDGRLHCENHTCGHLGCRTPKSSRVGACPEHLTSNA